MIGDGLPFAPKLYSESRAIRVVLLRMIKLEWKKEEKKNVLRCCQLDYATV